MFKFKYHSASQCFASENYHAHRIKRDTAKLFWRGASNWIQIARTCLCSFLVISTYTKSNQFESCQNILMILNAYCLNLVSRGAQQWTESNLFSFWCIISIIHKIDLHRSLTAFILILIARFFSCSKSVLSTIYFIYFFLYLFLLICPDSPF